MRNRAVFGKNDGASNNKNKSKVRSSESQLFAILLLVTFTFFILTTPTFFFKFYVRYVDFTSTPESFAGYYLFYNIAHKMHVTNHGVNFLLYVISGQKFRADLVKLFKRKAKAEVRQEVRPEVKQEVTSTSASVPTEHISYF